MRLYGNARAVLGRKVLPWSRRQRLAVQFILFILFHSGFHETRVLLWINLCVCACLSVSLPYTGNVYLDQIVTEDMAI